MKNRDKLLAAARRLMAAEGYAGTGTEAIVRAAGITDIYVGYDNLYRRRRRISRIKVCASSEKRLNKGSAP